MKENFISIGIPIYNAENYLEDAIKSVLAQTYPHWELILLDDGSTDRSLQIAQDLAIKDNRIRVISDGLNKKLPSRLNQIISESKYNYIVRMDADDIMHPSRLDKQISFLENNIEFDLVSSGLISIDNDNNVKGFRCVDKIYSDFNQLKLSYPIVHPSVMARRSWFERNKYSLEYPRAEDFELWTRSIMNNDFKMAVLPELLLYYREEGNLSFDKIISSYNDVLKIYSKYHNNSNFSLEVLKLRLKIIISNLLYYIGYLQKMASYRNKKFDEINLKYYQQIIDNIVSKEF